MSVVNSRSINVSIQLRRDNDYNYNRVRDTFIPANGEPILVDTAKDGLRLKIGDGVRTYSQLNFIDSLIVYGYLHGESFYSDFLCTNLIDPYINRLYVNRNNSKVYYYDGTSFIPVDGSPTATPTQAGIMKLYSTTGQNTDGTMTQKAITDGLNEKFEMQVSEDDEEMIIFSTNL